MAVTRLELQVASGDDDAHENADSSLFQADNNQITWRRWPTTSGRYNGGWRFANVTIPQGTAILKAWFTPYFEADKDNPDADIVAHDVDDAPDFTAPNNDVTGRLASKTTASVLWDQTGAGTGWVASPNIASVVQEIVDRAGWASGQAIVILAQADSGPEQQCNAESYEGDSALAAKLIIKHGTGVAIPHALRHERQRQNPTFAPFL